MEGRPFTINGYPLRFLRKRLLAVGPSYGWTIDGAGFESNLIKSRPKNGSTNPINPHHQLSIRRRDPPPGVAMWPLLISLAGVLPARY